MYARAIRTSGCLFALQHRRLRRRLSAALEHARTGFLVGRSDGVEAQRYAPLVSEVEDVGEPIASRQAQAVEPGVALFLPGAGPNDGISGSSSSRKVGRTGSGARPEPIAEPERVEVVVVPPEGGLEQVVEIDEGVVAADRKRPADAGPALQPRLEDVGAAGHVSTVSRAADGFPQLR